MMEPVVTSAALRVGDNSAVTATVAAQSELTTVRELR